MFQIMPASNHKMKAVVLEAAGGAENLMLAEVDRPEPGDNEILVKVKATALNRADILQRQGKYPPPEGASPILGLEMAGEVEKTGKNSQNFKIKDKVFGLIPGGGYAEYAIIHQDMALKIPANFSFAEAAAIPEVFLTSYQALIWLGNLKPDQPILIHAGGSGVGTAAIQLAKILNAKIIITASQAKHANCLQLGADIAIDYKKGPFQSEVLEYTNGDGVDLIIDFIGKPYFHQNINCLKTDGTLVLLAAMGGGRVQDVDLLQILKKRIHIKGSTLRSRPLDYQIKLSQEFYNFATPYFIEGKLKPVIDKVFNWKDVTQAHLYMESNKSSGKIVLEL
ncbi:NAD(P)H-quinone oxidoreductase [soil metagenome]